MRSSIFVTALAVLLPALAEELRASDVPPGCTTICQPIVTLTGICDIDPEEGKKDNDKKLRLRAQSVNETLEEEIEATCICTNTSFDVANVMGLCASCITQNGQTSNDLDKIMQQCSYAPQSYTPAATTIVAGIQVQATKPTTTVPTSHGVRNGAISVVAALGAGMGVLLMM